jgi:hypothetical protein
MPGQIRCPTCHRSTPPAAFCTQCGTAIPESARARPRGLDREELQDRIRTHRPGDAAFRRGSQVGGGEQGSSTYRPYQPEPEDELVLPGGSVEEGGAARVDNTAPNFDEPPPPIVPTAIEPPAVEPPVEPDVAAPAASPPVVAGKRPRREPQPAPWKAPPPPPPVESFEAPPPQWSAPEEPYAGEPDGAGYGNRGSGDEWNRRGSGMGPLAIGGFVLLGVLAIGVGAFMAGLFSSGTAVGSPSPTPLLSTLPSASAAASLQPSTGASVPASVGQTATPTAIADGFTAQTQPCAEQPASQDGCASSGATVSGGTVWVWVGWHKGSDADSLGVKIEDAAGATVGTGGPLALSSIGKNGCGASCNGWARFKFGGLAPGDYTIRIDRNGVQVAQASFTVNS